MDGPEPQQSAAADLASFRRRQSAAADLAAYRAAHGTPSPESPASPEGPRHGFASPSGAEANVGRTSAGQGSYPFGRMGRVAGTAPSTPSDISGESLVRSGLQGVTLGLADEAGAFGQAAGERLSGRTPDLMARYRALQAEEQAKLDAFQRDHSGVNLGAQLVGGLGLGLAAGARAGAPAVVRSLAGRIGVGAAEGAALGGIQGAAQADPGQRVAGGVLGAGGGALVGAAVPAVVTAATVAGRGLLRMGRAGAVPSLAGGQGAPAPTADVRPLEQIIRRLDHGNMSVADAQAKLDAAGSQPMTLADVSRPMQTLTDAISQTPTKGAALAVERLQARNYEAPGRTRDALTAGFGQPREYTADAVQAITAKQAATAQTLYDKALSHGAVNDPATLRAYAKVESLFPDAKASTLRTAKALDIPEQRLFVTTTKAVPDVKDAMGVVRKAGTPATQVPTVEYLHLFKQEVDKHIQLAQSANNARDAGSGPRLAGYTARQSEFVHALKNAVPAYADAADAFAGDEAVKAAMEQGALALRRTPDQVRASLRDLATASEQDAYRRGALDALHQRVGETSYGGNVKLTLDKNVNDREVLHALFPTEDAYTQFMRHLGTEGDMAATYRMTTGNSATARRLLEHTDLPVAAEATANVAFGQLGQAARRVAGAAARHVVGLTPEVSDALGHYLTLPAGPARDELLRALAKQVIARQMVEQGTRVVGRIGAASAGGAVGRAF